jgi:predicted PurR-regulated permease PerM
MDGPEDEPPTRAGLRRVEVTISPRTLGILVGLGVLIALAILVLPVLVAMAIWLVLALALSVPVDALERRGMGRTRAALIVFAVAFVIVVLIVVAIASSIYSEIRDFVDALPGYVVELENDSELRHLIQESGFAQGIRDNLDTFASELPTHATSLLGAASGVFGSVLGLVTLTFLSFYLVMELPAIVRGVAALMPPEQAARFETVSAAVARTVSLAVLGNIAISVIAGVVMGGAAWILGLPYPIVLGIVVGLLDLIPNVGATIAAVILGLIGLTVGIVPAVVIVIVDFVYQQVENYIVQPAVMREAVELSPFTTIVVVIMGAALLGVVGAILAVPVAGAIRVVLLELTRERRARMAALRVPS